LGPFCSCYTAILEHYNLVLHALAQMDAPLGDFIIVNVLALKREPQISQGGALGWVVLCDLCFGCGRRGAPAVIAPGEGLDNMCINVRSSGQNVTAYSDKSCSYRTVCRLLQLPRHMPVHLQLRMSIADRQ
jgi:hypothetical protein